MWFEYYKFQFKTETVLVASTSREGARKILKRAGYLYGYGIKITAKEFHELKEILKVIR